MSGTSASVVIVQGLRVFVAHVGHSGVVLARSKMAERSLTQSLVDIYDPDNMEALHLTDVHNVEDPGEQTRVKSSRRQVPAGKSKIAHAQRECGFSREETQRKEKESESEASPANFADTTHDVEYPAMSLSRMLEEIVAGKKMASLMSAKGKTLVARPAGRELMSSVPQVYEMSGTQSHPRAYPDSKVLQDDPKDLGPAGKLEALHRTSQPNFLPSPKECFSSEDTIKEKEAVMSELGETKETMDITRQQITLPTRKDAEDLAEKTGYDTRQGVQSVNYDLETAVAALRTEEQAPEIEEKVTRSEPVAIQSHQISVDISESTAAAVTLNAPVVEPECQTRRSTTGSEPIAVRERKDGDNTQGLPQLGLATRAMLGLLEVEETVAPVERAQHVTRHQVGVFSGKEEVGLEEKCLSDSCHPLNPVDQPRTISTEVQAGEAETKTGEAHSVAKKTEVEACDIRTQRQLERPSSLTIEPELHLPLSRSLGNFWSYNQKSFAVSPIPDIRSFQVAAGVDRFLIIASSGFWGVMTAREAVTAVAKRLQRQAKKIAEEQDVDEVYEMQESRDIGRHLITLALQKWREEVQQKAENISVMIVYFKPDPRLIEEAMRRCIEADRTLTQSFCFPHEEVEGEGDERGESGGGDEGATSKQSGGDVHKPEHVRQGRDKVDHQGDEGKTGDLPGRRAADPSNVDDKTFNRRRNTGSGSSACSEIVAKDSSRHHSKSRTATPKSLKRTRSGLDLLSKLTPSPPVLRSSVPVPHSPQESTTAKHGVFVEEGDFTFYKPGPTRSAGNPVASASGQHGKTQEVHEVGEITFPFVDSDGEQSPIPSWTIRDEKKTKRKRKTSRTARRLEESFDKQSHETKGEVKHGSEVEGGDSYGAWSTNDGIAGVSSLSNLEREQAMGLLQCKKPDEMLAGNQPQFKEGSYQFPEEHRQTSM